MGNITQTCSWQVSWDIHYCLIQQVWNIMSAVLHVRSLLTFLLYNHTNSCNRHETHIVFCTSLFLIVRHSKNKSRITHFITFSPHGHFSMYFSFIPLKIENAWQWGQAVRVCAPAVHLLLISQLKRRSYQKEEKNNHSGFKLTQRARFLSGQPC